MVKSERGLYKEEGFIQPCTDNCRKPLDGGLATEGLSVQLVATKRHYNGARAFEATQRAYNGGASVVDKVDRYR